MTKELTIDELRQLTYESNLGGIIAKPKHFLIEGDSEYGFPIWLKVPKETYVDGNYMAILAGGCFECVDGRSEQLLRELGFSTAAHRTVMTGKWRQTKQGRPEFEFIRPAECSHIVVWGTNYSPKPEPLGTPKIKPIIQQSSQVETGKWGIIPYNVELMCFKRQAALEPLIAHEEERLQKVIAQGDAAAEELKVDGPVIKRRFESDLIPKFLRLSPHAQIVVNDNHCTIDEGDGPRIIYFLWSSYDALSRAIFVAAMQQSVHTVADDLIAELFG